MERHCKNCRWWQGWTDKKGQRTCVKHAWQTNWDYLCRGGWEPRGRDDTEDDGYPD